MDYKKLAENIPESSRLAFGCSSIAGRANKKNSITAIKKALDLGITHFDVAPSYGYGEAEMCLGEALKTNRSKVVIATKVGIAAGTTSSWLRKLKPMAQKMVSAFPAARKIIASSAQFAGAKVTSNQFSAESIKASVEKSLRDLQTDYIDILFLHDCAKEDVTPELLADLESLKRDGKIRALGMATHIDVINNSQNPGSETLLPQFLNNLLLKNHEKLLHHKQAFITHSAFACFQEIRKIIDTQKNIPQQFGGRLNESEIYELMLRYALLANPNGIVICSMVGKSHLQRNIEALKQPRFTAEQVLLFADAITKYINNQ